ncbi:MAG: GBS Bsp-like repeat-containing protein, partial [Clostridiales bacterium]
TKSPAADKTNNENESNNSKKNVSKTPSVINDSQSPIGGNITVNTDVPQRKFTVRIDGIKDIGEAGIDKVLFRSSADMEGNHYLEWYTGKDLGNGTWEVEISLSKSINKTEKFYISVFADDKAKNRSFLGMAGALIRGDSLSHKVVTNNPVTSQGYFTLNISDIKGINYDDINYIIFSTWNIEDGGNKIHYKDYTLSENIWSTTVNLSDFNNKKGIYYIHIQVNYKDDKNQIFALAYVENK